MTPTVKQMAILTITEKINKAGEPIKYGSTLVIDTTKLIGVFTKSLYIRKGFKNGTLFLSQKANGAHGAGDICNIHDDCVLEVNTNLFDKLAIYAKKANAIIE